MMISERTYLAIDIGAESRRAIAATLDEGRLAQTEGHRFGNIPVRSPDGFHGDVLQLWRKNVRRPLPRIG
jgi:rhamnulokinase